MKKLTHISAAIVMVFGATAANAGNLSTATSGGTTFATEAFGPTADPVTTAIRPGAVTYTTAATSGIFLNAGTTVYFTVRLTGGKFTATHPANTDFAGSLLNVGGAGNGVVGVRTVSSDGTTAMLPITFTNAATIGVGSSLTLTPAAGSVQSVKATMGTAGGVVTTTWGMSAVLPVVIAPSTTTAPNTGTAQAVDLDYSGAAQTITIAKSAAAVTVTTSALSTYTGKIDLTASPASSQFALSTAPGTAVVTRLGSVTVTNASTAARALDGTTAANVAAAATGNPLSITVTPGTGQTFPVLATMGVSNDSCTTVVGALPAFTSTTASVAAVLTVPLANTTSANAVTVCLTAPATGMVATPITPTISASFNWSTGLPDATWASTTGAGSGYALTYNGSQIDTNAYWGNAVAAAGYNSYVRVINTGSVAAPISMAFINSSTGAVGTSAVVIASLPSGASQMLTAAQIEAAVGAQPNGYSAGRIRVTAPTNGLKTQSFLQVSAGAPPVEMSGAQ